MTTRAGHWDEVYRSRDASQVSWHEQRPETSLSLLEAYGDRDRAVVDVGAGESRLADALLADGWSDVTVLDVSAEALALVSARLGDRVALVVADVLGWTPEQQYGAWHDRAVFHFLTDPHDRDQYVATASRAVAAGGLLVLGAFALDGPTSCSGLPTARYDAAGLAAAFAAHFTLLTSSRQEHRTPGDGLQPFTWVVLRRHES